MTEEKKTDEKKPAEAPIDPIDLKMTSGNKAEFDDPEILQNLNAKFNFNSKIKQPSFAAPVYIPKNFFEQFAFSGGYLYVFINNAWVKIANNSDQENALLQPVGLNPANLTAVTALATNTSQLLYLGRMGKAKTTCDVLVNVTTAVATSIIWAEIAIFKGVPVLNGNASLSRVGFADVTGTFNSTGIKKTTVALSGVSAGDDLWVAYGSQATTPFQLRGMLADNIQSGVFQTYAGRPSTAAIPQATVLAGAAVVPAWVRVLI